MRWYDGGVQRVAVSENVDDETGVWGHPRESHHPGFVVDAAVIVRAAVDEHGREHDRHAAASLDCGHYVAVYNACNIVNCLQYSLQAGYRYINDVSLYLAKDEF